VSERDDARQGEPDGIDGTFPQRRPRRQVWFRAHEKRPGTADGGCWYYAAVPPPPKRGGRFDLASPRGTCYLADTALAVARERLGRPGRVVDYGEVSDAVVSEVRFEPGRVADLLHDDAALFGATRELSTSSPYLLSQQWAQALDSVGFEGIRYQPRFSSGPAEAIAAFGNSGVPVPLTGVATSRAMVAVLEANGYDVVRSPSTASLGPLVS
jgi:hypothetical protein